VCLNSWRQLASVAVPGEGFRRHAAAVVIDSRGFGDDGRSIILNPGAEVSSVSSASDSIGPVCDVANATNGTGRSAEDSWRVSVHEGGHTVVHRILGHEVCGVTIVPDADCSGRTWGPQGDVHAAAVWGPDCLANPGVSRDGDVNGLFSGVQAGVMGLMAGGAAEMAFLGDAPPKYIGSDIPRASDLAGYICRTTASIEAFLEFCYQESLAIIEQHKTVVLAIARALIDHPKHTLDGAEIDQCIADTLDREARQAEHKRRADWALVEKNAAEFSADLESSQLE